MRRLIFVIITFGTSWTLVNADTPSFKSDLSTEMTFSGADVSGRYNHRDEALAAVENEKSLSDLLTLRKNFKDRVIDDTKKK